MQLIGTILGQIIGVGVIAMIIVFQQEIRRFLLMVGSRYISNRGVSLGNLFPLTSIRKTQKINIKAIADSCFRMSKTKTGALIVLAKKSDMEMFAETGDMIHAQFSSRLLESIFHKGNPLHDGAVILRGARIIAARCVLPISEKLDLPAEFGMRHKAAIGMSEQTDSLVLVVSEENGHVSLSKNGQIFTALKKDELIDILAREFSVKLKD
jgi:uncharacterized protein (TIGR00159 family)